ncbi:MAG: hypothetical protein LUC37_06020 [Prevotella sp.]|nr:hypothetical protein [Prevotella sp.]
MKAFKGFDYQLRCRGKFQYEVGKTYRIPDNKEIEICRNGFHACTDPLDVLYYYVPTYCYNEDNRFAEVDLRGDIHRKDYAEALDSKLCAREITITRELSLEDLIDEALIQSANVTQEDVLYNSCEELVVGPSTAGKIKSKVYDSNHSQAISLRENSFMICEEEYSTAICTSGSSFAITRGEGSTALNVGHESLEGWAITFGEGSTAGSLGDSRYNHSVSYGCHSFAVSDGYTAQSITHGEDSTSITAAYAGIATTEAEKSVAINVGEDGECAAFGKNSIAANFDLGSPAYAAEVGSWIVITNYSSEKGVMVKAIQIDGKKYKTCTWYTLDVNGNIQELGEMKRKEYR